MGILSLICHLPLFSNEKKKPNPLERHLLVQNEAKSDRDRLPYQVNISSLDIGSGSWELVIFYLEAVLSRDRRYLPMLGLAHGRREFSARLGSRAGAGNRSQEA